MCIIEQQASSIMCDTVHRSFESQFILFFFMLFSVILVKRKDRFHIFYIDLCFFSSLSVWIIMSIVIIQIVKQHLKCDSLLKKPAYGFRCLCFDRF